MFAEMFRPANSMELEDDFPILSDSTMNEIDVA